MFLRGQLVVSALLLGASVCAAQAPPPPVQLPLPPAPVPVQPPAGGPAPVLVPAGGPPPVLVAPPPGTPVLVDPPPYLLPPPPLAICAPDLPPPPWRFGQPPGWFVALEASPTRVRVEHNDRHDRDGLGLGWTVAPRGELGYVFQNGGALLLSYRNVTASRTLDDDFGGQARARLNANWLDLTYLSRSYGIWSGLRWQWETGVRGAYLFADVQDQGDGFAQRTSNTFGGAGPHLGARLAWWFGDSGWSVFTRLDGAVIFGGTHERDALFYPGATGDTVSWTGGHRCHCPVGDFRFELGVSRVVPGRPWLRFDAGVQSEAFSWRDLTYSDSGPFLRCVLGF